jgi:O-antigen ligase
MPSIPRPRIAESIAAVAMAVSTAAAGLLVDPRAEGAFEAPKRLAALTAIVAATLAVLTLSRLTVPRPWRIGPTERRVALYLFLFAIGGAMLAALASPRRAVSLDAIRVMFLFGLLLPLGASRCLERGRSRALLAVFLVVCAINAVASILEALGVFEPLAIESITGRVSSVGFVGNEGYLALLMALAAVATLGAALNASTAPIRAAAWSALPLFLIALAFTRDVTGWIALAVGALPFVRERMVDRARRAWMAAAMLALLAGVMSIPALRARVAGIAHKAETAEWNSMLSYRPVPWSAALEMIRERPLLGYGPGTFAAEFVPHRLRAEIFWSRRLVNPQLNSFYAQAHCEYLQALAEAGIPAGLAATAAFTLLLIGLVRKRGPPLASLGGEAQVISAILLAGSIAALAWSPLQEPALAVPLLLAAGRGWRVLGEGGHGDSPMSGIKPDRMKSIGAALIGLALVAALVPEFFRYRAERRLYEASSIFRSLLNEGNAAMGETALLDATATRAMRAAEGLAGDSRPLILAGSARLLQRRPNEALTLYRRALRIGERAEIDLNIGRALALAGNQRAASAAILRAVWINPALISALPDQVQAPLKAALNEDVERLTSHRLSTPPPL